MLKILIIEILFSTVLGAVLFRLLWALIRSKIAAWSGVLIAAVIIIVFLPGHVDKSLIMEYGGKPPLSHELSPFIVSTLRCLGLVFGAWLASLAVAARKKIGLEDEPTYKDFP